MANVERLQQLRRVVEAAPEHRFHMRAWCEQAECGTAYCAAGWAAIDPWFREHTEIEGVFRVDTIGHVEINWSNVDVNVGESLARIFAIEPDEAGDLFAFGSGGAMDPHAISKREVLDNIDGLIDGHGTSCYDAIRGAEGGGEPEDD